MASLHRAAAHFRGPEFSYPGCWIRGVLTRAQERQWLSRKREPLSVISVSGCYVSFGVGPGGKGGQATTCDPTSDPSAGVCNRLPGSLDDQIRHHGRLGDEDRVTARDLDNCRACTLGHEALGGGWDHPVLGGH